MNCIILVGEKVERQFKLCLHVGEIKCAPTASNTLYIFLTLSPTVFPPHCKCISQNAPCTIGYHGNQNPKLNESRRLDSSFRVVGTRTAPCSFALSLNFDTDMSSIVLLLLVESTGREGLASLVKSQFFTRSSASRSHPSRSYKEAIRRMYSNSSLGEIFAAPRIV